MSPIMLASKAFGRMVKVTEVSPAYVSLVLTAVMVTVGAFSVAVLRAAFTLLE